jgi:hypothetical protein
MHIFEMPGDERCTDDSETRMSPRCLFVSVTMFIKLDEAAVSVCPEYRRDDDEFIPPGAKHLKGTALFTSQSIYLHSGGVEHNETPCSLFLDTGGSPNSL